MASVLELKRSLDDLKSSLVQEGILGEQFERLYIAGHAFARELITLFKTEAEKILNELTMDLDHKPVNYQKLDMYAHQLKGDSTSIGATRMVNTCIIFSDCCKAINNDGCVMHLQRLKDDYQLIKTKIESIHKLEDDIIAAGGSIE
ncbi:hypothetical protein J5N97_004160 [Dioscorea zingiberensis]|uniref:Histidine-containing phosphotransfer protein n=1 Tax=Dioscorea zingiberensis TaxID=325984 RepID=A0A9D5HR40_9LILI|nr:hypothetical protein J5N97_004160 [Dioscorea zingiberensis]